jgi:phosphate-selective porin OprO and OprP
MTSYKSIYSAILATSLISSLAAIADPQQTVSNPDAFAAPSTATGLLLGKFTGETAYDRIWSGFTLYKDDNNQVLQEFSLQGQFQLQYADGHANTAKGGDQHFDIDDSSRGTNGNDNGVWGDNLEARRGRIGFKSKWFNNWKFEGRIDTDLDGQDNNGTDTIYRDIYDLFVTYVQSDALNISVGKTKVKFSREQEISSKEILTFERSLASNLFFPGELTGAWVSGKGIAEHWLYELGIYGNDRVREFSEFDGGAIVLGKVGYDYASQVGLDSAVASIHYMHNTEPSFRPKVNPDFSNGTSPAFSDTIAVTNDIVQGRFGLTTEMLYGFGYSGTAKQGPSNVKINQSDVFGVSVIPSYFIADGLQLIGRLQYASSADANGLSLPSRYEALANNTAAGRNGNSYTAAYLGLNYYLYGHKLKLMNGIEYSKIGGGDYEGYTYLSGLRFSF